MSSHSPVPWHDRDDESCTHPVLDDSDFGAVRVISDVDYAHALHCVNAHDALVAAIAHAIFCLQPYKFGTGYPDLAGIYDDLNLAIARAQGQ